MRIVVVVMGCSLIAVSVGPVRPDDPPPVASQPIPDVDCSQVANSPYQAMTVEQCKAMLDMAEDAQSSMNDPAGIRPGDENMGCADIEAEMRTLRVDTVSAQHLAQGKAAAQDFQSEVKRQEAAAAVMSAKATAEQVAASVAGPVASTIAQQHIATEERVVGDQMARKMAPRQRAMIDATNAGMGDMQRAMQSSPRFARLIKLAMERGCRGEGDD